MTVTELREALQKLEAEGKGTVRIGVWDQFHERDFLSEPGGAELKTFTAENERFTDSRMGDFKAGDEFVEVR